MTQNSKTSKISKNQTFMYNKKKKKKKAARMQASKTYKPKKVKEKAIKLTLKYLKRDTKSKGRVGEGSMMSYSPSSSTFPLFSSTQYKWKKRRRLFCGWDFKEKY